jgi:hypothetical protein
VHQVVVYNLNPTEFYELCMLYTNALNAFTVQSGLE